MTTKPTTTPSILRRSLPLLILLFLAQPLLAYYCPSTGRFLSRDPIGESDGANVYAFTRNSPADTTDYLGLYSSDVRIEWKLPDPRNIAPLYEDLKNKPGNKFPNSPGLSKVTERKISCKCIKDPAIGKCVVHCTVSAKATITLTNNPVDSEGNPGIPLDWKEKPTTPRGVFGHEQQHILDINNQIRKYLKRNLGTGEYDTPERCQEKVDTIHRLHQPALQRIESKHWGKPGASGPVKARQYEPLEGSLHAPPANQHWNPRT